MKWRVLAVLLLVVLGAGVYQLCRQRTPEELVAAAFENSGECLDLVGELREDKSRVAEVTQEIYKQVQEMRSLIDEWYQLEPSVSDDEAAKILSQKYHHLKIKRRIGEAYELYQKLGKLYRSDESFRNACDQYVEVVRQFPGLKANLKH